MPRRPSATAIPSVGSPGSSQVQVQRPTDLHPAFIVTAPMGVSQPSIQTLGVGGPAATPQQKVVQVLMIKLKNKVSFQSCPSVLVLLEELTDLLSCPVILVSLWIVLRRVLPRNRR